MLRAKYLIPLALFLGAGWFFLQRVQPTRVRVDDIRTGQVVRIVYATGAVRPDTETRVAAEVSGRIVALLVDEGDMVRAGELVARLDDAAARSRLQEWEGRLTTARARLKQMEAPTDSFVVSGLESQVRGAGSKSQTAEERVRLAEDRVTTAIQSALAAEAAVPAAEARVKALESSARAARSEIETAQRRVETNRAELEQARANAASARDLVERRRQLLREGAIAERQVTEATTALQAADAAITAARGRVASAEQSVASARASADAAAAQVEDARAAIAGARATAAAARNQVAEARSFVSEQKRMVDSSRQDVVTLRSQLGQARRGARQVDLAVMRADVRTQEAAVRQARTELARYAVISPVTGRVTDRPVDPGDFVQPGNRLFVVAQEQRSYVQADVDEADIGEVRVGSEARFQVDSQPGVSYLGRVSRIGRDSNPATKTYPVDIREIQAPDGQKTDLKLGMTADVNIRGRTIPDVVLAPTAALQTDGDKTVVWVVEAGSRVRKRVLRIRARDAKTVQVVEGLRAGEQVVLEPVGLSDDRVVQIVRP